MNATRWIMLIVAFILGGLLAGRLTAQQRRPAPPMPSDARILFLHHSTGECIYSGGVPGWFAEYNAEHGTHYAIEQRNFPAEQPYGWENFPYDYWNIWVRNAGPEPYRQEPTLEMLTPRYDLIVFKHCFPVSNIEPDTGRPDVASADKRIENYKLQYEALKTKLRSFPGTRFLVWAGAAQVRGDVDEVSALRARDFFRWVRETWDEPGDNIYVWDFYTLETAGGLYMNPEYASGDAHPNERFSQMAAPLFGKRMIDVIQGRGDTGSITGGELTALGPQPEPPDKPLVRVRPQPVIPAPAPSPAKDAWVYDDYETPARFAQLWEKGAKYVEADGGHAVQLDLTAATREDWGEYGEHLLIYTKPPAENYDITKYRYLALRAKTDQDFDLVVTVLTLPQPQGDRYQPHFGFSAYPHLSAGDWQWIVLDLNRLELAVEGAGAYKTAGSPPRPQQLTALKFAVNARHEKAEILIDDVTWYGELPAGLRNYVPTP